MNTKKTLLLVGGLAAVAAVGYFMFKKPRKNSDGFYSADGTRTTKVPCRICEGSDGVGYFAQQGNCRRSDTCRQTVKQFASS
jgi:hypothetical protein